MSQNECFFIMKTVKSYETKTQVLDRNIVEAADFSNLLVRMAVTGYFAIKNTRAL
jgi:hypothetical protein